MSAMFPSWHDPAFIGPLMFGTLLQFGILCILIMQAVVFFARQGHGFNDGRLFQLYAAAVLLFTTLQVTFGLWRLYNICVLLHPWVLLQHAWFEVVLIGVVIESVHGFFIFRCYKLSRSKLVVALILAILIAQGVAAIATTVSSAKAQLASIRTTSFVVVSTTVALDALISITLFVNLWRQQTGQKETDAVILRIIRLTVESIVPCLICVVIVLVGATSLGKAPLGPLFASATPLLSPLYANALFTSLNYRPELRRQLDRDRDNGTTSTHDNIQFAYPGQSQRTSDLDIRQIASRTRRGSTTYDIALTSSIELSKSRGTGSEQTISKTRSLTSDGDNMPNLCP